eukprot:TRINITY_DN2041_c0_g1_i2.p1 TRINITY_DN2041_c0_g1~~TRINITY_DN2041_c0_g1_i2.p1  ORF type:complete len:1518 (+),score=333.19 TRINITY_DN2041_c0_g1_i2:101-4555(+)
MAVTSDERCTHVRGLLRYAFAHLPCERALELMLWSLGMQPPEASFEEIKRYAPPPSVCGLVWKHGATAYKCRECESDPTCAVCVQCFVEADHTGHDYYMVTTGGGCCDCGDPAAWNSKGFCKRHKGPTDDPSLYLPPRLKPTIAAALTEVVVRLAHLLAPTQEAAAAAPVPSAEDAAAAAMITERIRGLCKDLGDGVTRAVSRAFCESDSDTSPSPLSALVRADLHYPQAARTALHALYFLLLSDQVFKEALARRMIEHYSVVYAEYAAGLRGEDEEQEDDGCGVLSFSVQLFTVRGLTHCLVDSAALLETLTGSALACLAPAVRMPDGPLDLAHDVIKRRHYWRVFHDLRYVLQQADCAAALLFDEARAGARAAFLRLASIIQGIDAAPRELVTHVPFASSTWTYAFQIVTFDFMPAAALLLPGLHAGTQAQALAACGAAVSALRSWLDRVLVPPQVGDDVCVFDPLRDPFTFHLPLHRTLAILVRGAHTHQGLGITDLLGCGGDDFPLRLAEHPLRILVLLSQIRCGMWARNGEGVQQQAHFYRASINSYELCLSSDLFCLQVAALLCPASRVVSSFLRCFALSACIAVHGQKRASPSAPGLEDSERRLRLVEDCLWWLLAAACERDTCDCMTDVLRLRRCIVHALCVADLTYSQAAKAAPNALAKHPKYDEVLHEVSNVIPATGMEPEKYQLKPECWAEYDPYYTRYHPADAARSEERYFQQADARRRAAGGGGVGQRQRTPPAPRPGPAPAGSPFAALPRLLHTHLLHSLAWVVLYNAARGAVGEVSERLVVLVIHYLTLAAETHELRDRSEKTDTPGLHVGLAGLHFPSGSDLAANTRAELSPPGVDFTPEPASVLSLLVELSCSTRFAEQAVAAAAAALAIGRLDPVCKAYVDARLGASGAQRTAEGRTRRLADSRRKQQEIMRKFAAQQREFARLHASGEDAAAPATAAEAAAASDTAEYTVTDTDYVCVMCREHVMGPATSPQKPVGFIAYAQRTSLLAVAGAVAAGAPPETPAEDNEAAAAERELLRPVDGPAAGIFVTCCSHAIHVDCYASYFDSLVTRQANREEFEGRLFVDLRYGEFCCPACRRIANCILPLTTDDGNGDAGVAEKEKGRQTQQREQEHQPQQPQPQQPQLEQRGAETERLRFARAASAAAQRFYAVQHRTPGRALAPAPYVASALATTVAVHELRSRDSSGPDARVCAQLHSLFRLACAGASGYSVDRKNELLSLLSTARSPCAFSALAQAACQIGYADPARLRAIAASCFARARCQRVFLRRAALLWHIAFASLAGPPPNLDDCAAAASRLGLGCLSPADRTLPAFALVPLPEQYITLFQQCTDAPCACCGVAPARDPALCLVCGAVLCARARAAAAVELPGLPGECSAHAASRCLCGVGVFLLVRHAEVIILLPYRGSGCRWGSMYVDEHKEPDLGLKRGRPLFLDEGRYEQLRALVLAHDAENLCSQHHSPFVRWLDF